jgi:hypothetical protein
MAAAVMAMEHFNERNPVVVPELVNKEYSNCDVQFDLNTSRFFDTGMITHRSTHLLLQEMLAHGIPCALAGPYSDLPSQLLSTFAASAEIPLVAHRALNLRVVSGYFAPFSSVVYPDQQAIAAALVRFLRYKERFNYIAVLYGLGDTSLQHHEVVINALSVAGIQYKVYRYEVFYSRGEMVDPSLEIKNVLRKVKKDGYRTIVSISEFPEREIDPVAAAADEVGVNNEEYFWIFIGVDLSVFSLPPVDVTMQNLRFLAGGAMLSPLEGFQVDADDRFLQAWQKQNESFVERVNAHLSVGKGRPGYYKGEPEYFETFPPLSGAGFMYDAIISIGTGACLAGAAVDRVIPGAWHQVGIRSTNFTGATGRVRMNNIDGIPSRRDPSSVRYGIVNLFERFALADESEWQEMLNFSEGSDLYVFFLVRRSFDEC